MYRGVLNIYDDGTIGDGGSSGADSHEWYYWTIDSECYELNLVEYYEGIDGVYYHDDEEMSEDRFFNEAQERLDAAKMELEWTEL